MDDSIWLSGPVSSAHRYFVEDCAACHEKPFQQVKDSACMACHQVDKKVVGPSFTDISKKYAGKKGADAQLATKVLKGGGGVWGTMPMPANPQVSEAEAKQLVKWILTLK